MSTGWLLLAGLLIGLAALLAMIEAALASVSHTRAQRMLAEGRPGAARLVTITSEPARFVNTTLFLRLAAEIGAIVIVTAWSLQRDVPDWQALLAAFVAMLLLSFVAVGAAPRTVGRQNAEGVARVAAAPVVLVTRVLGPVSALLIAVGNALTPGKGFPQGPFSTEAELRELVDEAETQQLIEPGERRMIHSVFELGDTWTREVMVPRTDMITIERTKSLRQCMSLALRSGFSRIPVIGENLDDVVGVVYLKDVVRRIHDTREAESTEPVDSIMRPATFVPDSKPADDLLREMQAQRSHVAIVVDEYGGTAGLVTIEDVLEEIVGEIQDEYDTGAEPIQYLPDGAVRVSARVHVDDLGEVFGVELDDDDVDTVAGLLAKELGRVPIPGASVEVSGLRLVAESTAGRRNRIGTLLVTPVDLPAQQEELA